MNPPSRHRWTILAGGFLVLFPAMAEEGRSVAPEPDPLAVSGPATPATLEPGPGGGTGGAMKEPVDPAPDRPPGDGDFVRFRQDGAGERLQTGVVRYRRDDRIVDLVGAVHLADPGYFDDLNTQLGQYDAVLYEMVGGEFETRGERAAEPEVEQVRRAHGLIRQVLGMEYQTEGIDYDRPHFIHADIDWTQYRDLMASRNQSLATLFERAMAAAERGEGPPILTDDEAAGALLNRLVSGLATGNTAELKRALAPVLGESEALIAQIEGEDGTVLVTERNKVVMSLVDRTLQGGARNLAIFYGAGHLPDLEKRLLAAGFRKEAGVWLTAWDIADPGPGGGGNLWQSLFSDPELVQSLMGNVQEFLRQLQGGGAREP